MPNLSHSQLHVIPSIGILDELLLRQTLLRNAATAWSRQTTCGPLLHFTADKGTDDRRIGLSLS